MPYSKEHVGEWLGVYIPAWLRVFDCRRADDEPQPRAPWGETLWSSECAAFDLGLRESRLGYHDCTPISCQVYQDLRTVSYEEIARCLRDAFREAAKLRETWEKARRRPSTDGGSVCDLPIAVAICNFGWSVIADRRQAVVAAFGSK